MVRLIPVTGFLRRVPGGAIGRARERVVRPIAVTGLLLSVFLVPPPAFPGSPGPQPAPAPAPADAPAGRGEDPSARARGLVEKARSSFLDAEFEQAAAAAGEAISLLEGPAGKEIPPPDRRGLLATALDLLAQSRFNLGDEGGMNEAIRRLLAVDPGYRVDVEIAGPKYVKLFEGKRAALVGFLAVECRPLPCETVTVDGRGRSPGEQGRVALVAGRHRVVVSRHGFEPADLGELEVPAGKETRVEATLRQVARDVIVVTDPPGADISLDGTPAGTTAPSGNGGEASAPLVLRNVPPGNHVLVATAPCRRRVEQALEVVLDEQDPGPVRLPPIEMVEARGTIRIPWDGREGLLTLDGSPVRPGEIPACPGNHEVSLAVAGRRVFVATVAVRDGETVTVRPRPRPTLALAEEPGGSFPSLAGEEWNHVPLPGPAAEEAARVLSGRLDGDGGGVPTWPAVLRLHAPEAAAPLLAAAPEADLAALSLPVNDPVRRLVRLVLVDLRRGIVEAVAWPEDDREAAAGIDRALAWRPPARDSWTGLDLAERVTGAPVVAQVTPGSPAEAAGIRPGELLLAVAGRDVHGMAEAERLLARLPPGREAGLRLLGEEAREVKVVPLPVVHVDPPARLSGRLLLPALASAGVLRVAGAPDERIPAAVAEGLLLAATGADLEAARVLDRVTVDAAEDPEGDARGTLLWVLEGLLRRIDRDRYADEIAARLHELPRARLGGRRGPPLALAGDD